MPDYLSATEIVSQVSLKLVNGFRDEITTVYKDTPISGMVKPCFFIQQLNTVHRSELRNRGDRRYFLDVRAHPKDDEDNKQTWCNTVGDKLFSVLDSIEVSEQRVKSSTMRFEIIDNVLHFFVEYSFKVAQTEEPNVKMRTLDTNEYVDYGKGR